MDKTLFIKEIKGKIKYFTKEINNRTSNADDSIKFNDIVKWFEGQRAAYKDMLKMIVDDAPRL